MLDLRTLPKGHLHVHLEACMRLETLRELAAEDGRELPALDLPSQDGHDHLTVRDPWARLVAIYTACVDVLTDEVRLHRLIDEAVADAVADGAVWFEPTVLAPLHLKLFGDGRTALREIAQMVTQACDRHRIHGGVLAIADRMGEPAAAEGEARNAAALAGSGVVAYGLANMETGHPGAPFARAFDIAHAAGLVCAPHAGLRPPCR